MEWALVTSTWENGETTQHWFASPDGREWLEFKTPPPSDAEDEIRDYLANGRDGFIPIRADLSYLTAVGQRPGSSVAFFKSYPEHVTRR